MPRWQLLRSFCGVPDGINLFVLQTAFGSATATTPQASPLRLRAACCRSAKSAFVIMTQMTFTLHSMLGPFTPYCFSVCSLQHPVRGKLARFVCNANDRTAAPNAAEVRYCSRFRRPHQAKSSSAVRSSANSADGPLQAPSPDGTAVLENSQQFKVHLLAAIEDPRVKE